MDVSCIPESGCCCLFVSLFLHFSLKFSNIKNFVALLSGIVSPRKLKLGTHMNSGWMYCVYRHLAAAAAYSSLFSFFFLFNFQKLKFFITLFSGTVKPRYWKLVTHVDRERMYLLYCCCCLFIPLFLHFSFSPVFKHLNISMKKKISRTVRHKKLKQYKHEE